jgi:TPR repeat protein
MPANDIQLLANECAKQLVELGIYYQHDDVPNLKKAYACYEVASKLCPTYIPAWKSLSNSYLNGIGTPVNTHKALACDQKATSPITSLCIPEPTPQSHLAVSQECAKKC